MTSFCGQNFMEQYAHVYASLRKKYEDFLSMQKNKMVILSGFAMKRTESFQAGSMMYEIHNKTIVLESTF